MWGGGERGGPQSGRKKEDKQSCRVYWATVEATCRVDILARYKKTSGGGSAAIF